MVDAASQRQIDAADPRRSTWLSANAGSGKTKVLTDRVARLLIDGTAPQNILCLTYTRAAAGEMQNRLFRRLGEWAMLGDAQLSAGLAEIGVAGPFGSEELARARRLFARAIETPGGLKIQTIHSFCAAILRQFPVEAGVSPRFTEMDEHAAKVLVRDIVDALAEGDQAQVLADLAIHFTGQELEDFAGKMMRHAEHFRQPPDIATLRRRFGASGQEDAAGVMARVVESCGDFLTDLEPLCTSVGGATNLSMAGMITEFGRLTDPAARFRCLAGGLLTKEGAPRRRLVTKPVTDARPELIEALVDLANDLAGAVDEIKALNAAERTAVFYRFGQAVTAAYAARKAELGMLDFDDLIINTLDLLTRSGAADWVLYRLDGGIDHILVDEAQDTSPRQWQVIEALSREITSGTGSRADVPRTLFVVGDPKQSIYSFQGADPREFSRMRDAFADRLAGADAGLQRLQLQHSFRSSPLILSLVDRVFADPLKSPGLGETPEHFAFFGDRPGRIDLWPVIPRSAKETPPEWWDTTDQTQRQSNRFELAKLLAEQIEHMIAHDTIPDGKTGQMRRVQPGDILILVRRRSFISGILIDQLKARGLNVAGADVIELAAELAVRDLIALLSVVVTPTDDLSLASALRSPVFGLSEAQLYDLAHHRKTDGLWDWLDINAGQYPHVTRILDDLRDQADFLRPYEMIERILTRHDARRRMVARLGPEVEDAIDVLLQQALSYEQNAVPSLTGFLEWIAGEPIRVKREAGVAADAIRVMTVHGAKGLESPIVILPDTVPSSNPHSDPIGMLDGQPYWKPRAEDRPPATEASLAAEKEADAEEDNRLLYVALTRAQNWLLVCGAAGHVNKSGWHDQISEGFQALGVEVVDTDNGHRIETGDWALASTKSSEADPLPQPLTLPPPPPFVATPGVTIITPSGLAPEYDGAGTGGIDPEMAMRRGRQLHLLLEHLPQYSPADWPELAATLLGEGEDLATNAEIADLLAEAGPIARSPDLAHLFAPGSMAEVGLAADLPGLDARLNGRIDRLVPWQDGWLAVDYKSNFTVPDSPADVSEGYLRQMAAYRVGLRKIFPETPISTAILWTRAPGLMLIPDDIVTAAWERYTTS